MMKKILCLLLCVVFSTFALVSCSDDEYGYNGEYDKYYSPDNREKVTLDFYIIVGEGTQENAIKTVSRAINQYTEDKFTTSVNMHYVTAAEYESTVKNAADDTTAARADIVLIVGADMFDYFNERDLLVNISDYYSSTDFGKIKNNIVTTVYNASFIDNAIYTVANNSVIDSYDFVLVKQSLAGQVYNYGTDRRQRGIRGRLPQSSAVLLKRAACTR